MSEEVDALKILPPLHFPSVKMEDDFQVLMSMVRMIYYTTNLSSGNVNSMKRVPDKVVMAVTLYIMYGWSEEGKQAVSKACSCKDKFTLNSLNKTLRDFGFMNKNNMNSRISDLNPYLKKLREAYLWKNKLGLNNMTFSVTFTS